MKHRSIALAAATAAILVAGTPAVAKMPNHKGMHSEQCTRVSTTQVAGWFDTFNAAWATKDPATVTALFTKDAVLLPTVSNKPRLTPAEVNDYFVKFLKGSPVGSIDTSTIRIGCNTAYRLGTWTVKLTDATTGAVGNVKARYSFIYKMENGQWKIEHLHSSAMPEPVS